MAKKAGYKKSKVPDFNKVVLLVEKESIKVADVRMHEFAERERNRFVAQIKKQDFPSFKKYPLTPEYVDRKTRAGADERVMLATHTYVDSIKVFRSAPQGIPRFRIDIHGNKRARNLDGTISEMPMRHVALIHEYGSVDGNIPARTHWRPFLKGMAVRSFVVRDRIAKEAVANVLKKLKYPHVPFKLPKGDA